MLANSNNKKLMRKQKFILLFGLMLILVFLAIISFLPYSQSPFKKCTQLVIPQNRYSCLSSLANLTSNASICGYLPNSYAAACYANLGDKLNNVTLCKYALNISSTEGSSCIMNLSYATDNSLLCAMLNMSNTYSCATGIGINSGVASACNVIANTTDLSACTSSVNFVNAIRERKPELCSLVAQNNSTSFSDMIFSNVENVASSVFGNNSEIFVYFAYEQKPQISPRDMCYLSSAKVSNNSTGCSNITSQDIKSLCFSYVQQANQTTGTALNYTAMLNECNSAGQMREECIDAVLLEKAVQTKNVTICKSLPAQSAISCYTNLAVHYRNATYCGFISNASENSACIFSVDYNSTT